MPKAVKLSDEIVDSARLEGGLMQRSAAGQLEYWANLGRSLESSGLSYRQIRFFLSRCRLRLGGNSPEISSLESELHALDGSDDRELRDLEGRSLPVVGIDDDGNLVTRRPR